MIISIINHKGGTGKTTSSVNISACLADLGYKVLYDNSCFTIIPTFNTD